MNEYDIKRGHYDNIEGDGLGNLMKELFGNVKKKNDKLSSNFGALDNITVWIDGKKTLCVDTKMNTDVDDKTATDTIRAYNQFLERGTGFNTKERKKRANKK
ncbi:MAG: DUF5611 family protein [Thermoplasmata archaeon]|nr:DUF5611 family protein [Thermoplasmata archaeon]MCK5397102.1 DUF5611 family protein [Thermoplasmata archaeon]